MLKKGLLSSWRTITGAFLALVLLGVMGRAEGGQAAPAKAPAQTAQPAKPAAKKAKAAKPASTAKKKVPAKTTQAGKKAPAKRPLGGKVAAVRPRAPMVAGRRDPFKAPKAGGGQEVSEMEEVTGALPPGTRGILASQIKLEGVVREDLTNTMIAIVTTNTNRAYFLRENDEIYNGMVSKIGTDAIYLKVNYHDPMGRVQTREVVARLGSGPGEGR